MAFTLPGTALISSWGVAEEAAEVLMDGRQLVSAAVPQRFLPVLRSPPAAYGKRGWRPFADGGQTTPCWFCK